MADERSHLVYSTDREISRKQRPAGKAPASGARPEPKGLIVRLDRKGRAGKSVTVIEGLRISRTGREELFKQCKARLGTGGTLTDTGFEIQGDHRDALVTALQEQGFRPKRSGG